MSQPENNAVPDPFDDYAKVHATQQMIIEELQKKCQSLDAQLQVKVAANKDYCVRINQLEKDLRAEKERYSDLMDKILDKL